MWKKQISNWQLWFAAIGGIVGSGWLLGPFYAAKLAGPASILAWALGGFLMLFIALTFAELATTYPMPGGMARYAQMTHGTLASFIIAWVAYLAAVIVPPIETMAAVQYLADYFPKLMHHHQSVHSLTVWGILTCAGIMLVLCVINQFSVKVFAKSNSWIVTWKLTIPILAIIALISKSQHWHNLTAFGGFFSEGWPAIFHALPVAGIVFSFIGYSAAIQLAGEAKNPQRAIPLAIIGSIVFAIILYVLIELAFIIAIPSSMLSQGFSHLSFAQYSGPIAGLMSVLGIVWFVKLIYIDAIVSPIGTAFIYTAASARITHAMASNGYFPKAILALNPHGSPARALVLNFLVGLLFFLPFPGWQQMVGFIVVCFILSYIIGPIAVLHFRKRQPDVERPFKLPMVKLITFCAFVICNCFIYWTGWSTVWRMMVVIAIGLIYLSLYRLCQKEHSPLQLKSAYWLFAHLVGMAIISYCGVFGGGQHYLSFGWDFVVITIFSAIIGCWALCSALKDTSAT